MKSPARHNVDHCAHAQHLPGRSNFPLFFWYIFVCHKLFSNLYILINACHIVNFLLSFILRKLTLTTMRLLNSKLEKTEHHERRDNLVSPSAVLMLISSAGFFRQTAAFICYCVNQNERMYCYACFDHCTMCSNMFCPLLIIQQLKWTQVTGRLLAVQMLALWATGALGTQAKGNHFFCSVEGICYIGTLLK